MAVERTPTPRVVLMEFEVPSESLPEEVRAALGVQFDAEDLGAADVTILVPVGRGEGGRIGVIESTARAAGKFRAPAASSWQSRLASPPPQQRLDFKDGD